MEGTEKKTKGLIVRRMRGWPAGGNVAQSGPPGEARTLTDVRWHDAASQILHYKAFSFVLLSSSSPQNHAPSRHYHDWLGETRVA